MAWGTGRQVPVARLLAGVDIAELDDGLGRRAGMLLARRGLADAIDHRRPAGLPGRRED